MNKMEQPQSVSGAFNELLNKMYISNVQNRLRELNEPTENDCKRWVWELIQNAKDSISQDKSKESVDIKLIIKDKEVQFLHNGSPFTAKALLGLLYKYSEGKVDSNESIGRFGTGFLTTHTLSKIVSIEGNLFTDNANSPLYRFSATMFRDGSDEFELSEGMKKMQESITYTQEINSWTTYTYHLQTSQNENALQLGLENFISNIAQTMLFCKELNSVELNNNDITTKIIRREVQLLDGNHGTYLSEFEFIEDRKLPYIRKFIHKSLKRSNSELSKRFRTERYIRLTAAIEIDDNKNLIENQSTPSHFCVLPLVGSEKHIMPIYLNSPDFEPDSERENLILIGDDMLADKGVISEGGINRLILRESAELYESLVLYLSKNDYHKLFLLAKGLKKIPKVERKFDGEWFKKEIIEPYRNILKKYAVVETPNGNQYLFTEDNSCNIVIPKDSNIENQIKIYDLSIALFADKLPLPNIAKDWAKLAWDECGLFKIEDLCKYIAEKGNIDNLPVSSDRYDWLNRFLFFIKDTNESLLKEYALVPNRNGDFLSLENEKFAEGVGLTEYMIAVLNDLGEDLTPILLDSNITAINLPLKIDIKSIADKLNEQVNKIIKDKDLSVKETIKRLLPLLNTIPSDENKHSIEFICKQKRIHGFSKTLYEDLPIYEERNDDIPEKAYQVLHQWLIKQLMESTSEYKEIESLPETIENKVEWINSFIAFVLKELKEGELDECSIIPNQKGFFCHKHILSKDINIPEELKSERAERFGIKLKDTLLHKGIDSINITSEKNINTVVEIINEIFKNNNFEEGDDDLDFAVFLVHFLPKETSELLYTFQKSLLCIINKYYYKKSALFMRSVIPCDTEALWLKANDKIVKSLQSQLEKDANLENLKLSLSKSGRTYDDGDTFIFLNDFYDYLKKTNRNISGKIIPNQNGFFCSLDDDFYRDEDISEELKEILCKVNSDADFRKILAETSLSIQPSNPKKNIDIAKAIDDGIKKLYENNRNWENEDFITAIQRLMIKWFPNRRETESRDIFPYTYNRKETIEMNILWSLEDRQRMQRAKSIPSELLDKFIDSCGNIDSLEKKREELEARVAELQAQVEYSASNDIITKFPDITVDRIRELLRLEERIKGWNGQSDYKPANEVEEKRNFENGYKGEAYVYSQLVKTGNFKNVIWEHKSETPTNIEILDYEGNNYYIKDDYSEYDLIAETYNENRIYIEVKSTRTGVEQADTIALPISSREWKFVNQISDNDIFCLARVFDVENNPEGHYLSLMGIKAAGIK